MDAPNKRPKLSPPGDLPAQSEFVSLTIDDGDTTKFGYGAESTHSPPPTEAPRGPRAHHPHHHQQHTRDPRFDRRNAQDHPVSQHALPGHEPWILVKTKFSRRFVHNTRTRESLWRVPAELGPAVRDFEAGEEGRREREGNARWAEEQLGLMRGGGSAVGTSANVVGTSANVVGTSANAVAVGAGRRRRRSESLQREDEAAVMAELAVEVELAAEVEPSAVEGEVGKGEVLVKTVEPEAGDVGYDSEGSYEYVEVTDDEGEGEARAEPPPRRPNTAGFDEEEEAAQLDSLEDEPALVEFGEDDIAHQLAAMGEAYGLDAGEYGSEPEEGWDEGVEGLAISDADAANLFREMLDEYRVDPFTPWEKIIADESAESVVLDDRYTVLPTMKARRGVFDGWVRERVVLLREERGKVEKVDPRIAYLAFLGEKATPKLYWTEFKRRFKREAVMGGRDLADRERERLYREFVLRMRLPEAVRKGDLLGLLKSVPLSGFNGSMEVGDLPQQVRGHLHFVGLSGVARDAVVAEYLRGLPLAAPAEGGGR
ncbi:hypothetical protein LTR08_007201 [Meristemomyces frigidus]|nr:hypothetical protein LTR08_007201 [Meristemomyces frigidus]